MAKNYTFYWNDGTRKILEGQGPSFALIRNGYSPFKSLSRYEFYIEGKDEGELYEWDENNKKWKNRFNNE